MKLVLIISKSLRIVGITGAEVGFLGWGITCRNKRVLRLS
jgi:hypothetical protein